MSVLNKTAKTSPYDSLGLWIPQDSGFERSGFRILKRARFQFFFCFNAFLRISFSCSNLVILKYVVRMHNKFAVLFRFITYRRNIMYYSSVRVYGIIMRGKLGDCPHRSTTQKKNQTQHHRKKTWRITDIAVFKFVLRLI